MQKVFVSIVNYNGKRQTKDCLSSILKTEKKDFELFIVVVDNASKDNSMEEIKELVNEIPNLTIIKNEKNMGFSGGHNTGIRYAIENSADFVVVLNNDVVVEKTLFVELLKTFEEKKDCGIVSPKIYFEKGREFHTGKYKKEELGKVFWYAGGEMDWKNVLAFHRGVDEVDKGQFDILERTNFASGCCMAVKKEVFLDTGLFDEKYFLYFEDNDLSQRAKKKGFGIYYQPKGLLWHMNAGSTGGSGSSLQDYYITRNRLLFGMKFASIRAKSALLKEGLKLILNGRKWQKKGAIDFYSGRFGKGSYV